MALQHRFHHAPHAVFVFHQEYGLGAAGDVLGGRRLQVIRGLSSHRKFDAKRGSLAGRRFHAKISAIFLDDSVAGGEAEPGAVLFGGEERLKDTGEHLCIHADARIADGEGDASRAPALPAFLVSSSSLPPPGIASRAFTTIFKITCSICPGSARTVFNCGASMAVNSMSSPSMRRNMRSISRTSALRSTSDARTPCRRLKASNWRVRSVARSEALTTCSRSRRAGSLGMHGVQQHVRIAGDDHEQVVEIVRDAARQTSHGFQSLRMMELLFQAFALGDVARVHHHAIDSGDVRKIARKGFQHAPRSVAMTDAAFHRPWPLLPLTKAD